MATTTTTTTTTISCTRKNCQKASSVGTAEEIVTATSLRRENQDGTVMTKSVEIVFEGFDRKFRNQKSENDRRCVRQNYCKGKF